MPKSPGPRKRASTSMNSSRRPVDPTVCRTAHLTLLAAADAQCSDAIVGGLRCRGAPCRHIAPASAPPSKSYHPRIPSVASPCVRFSRSRIVVAAALCASVLAGSSTAFPAAMIPPAPRGTASRRRHCPAATVEFNARKDHYLDVMAAGRSFYYDYDAAVGLLMLERAERTGDHGDVAEANRLVIKTLRQLEVSPTNDQFSAQHGGAFTLLRLVLQFGDQPEAARPADARGGRPRQLSGRRERTPALAARVPRPVLRGRVQRSGSRTRRSAR